jgi:hypothetical protein
VLGADGARAAPPHPQPPQTAWVGAQRAGGSLRAHARRRQVPVHTAAQQQRILQGRPRPLPTGRLRVAGPGSGRQAGPGHADLRARLPLLADTALSSCAPCAPCAPPTHTALRLPIASPFAQENSIFIFLQATNQDTNRGFEHARRIATPLRMRAPPVDGVMGRHAMAFVAPVACGASSVGAGRRGRHRRSCGWATRTPGLLLLALWATGGGWEGGHAADLPARGCRHAAGAPGQAPFCPGSLRPLPFRPFAALRGGRGGPG